MFSTLISYLTWSFIMAPPYKQISLSAPPSDFTKQCICPEGGPNGTRRCRNKSYCDLVRNNGLGLVDEAAELTEELLDDWPLLGDAERKVKAHRPAFLRCCTKDLERCVEVGDKMLAQRREEAAEQQRQEPVRVAPVRLPASFTLRRHKAEAPSRPTLNNHTLAAFLDQLPTPPAYKPKARSGTPLPPPPPFPGLSSRESATAQPPPPPRSSTTASSRTLRADSNVPGSLADRVQQLEGHVQSLQAELQRSERETNKWRRKYQGLRTLYDRILNLVRQDDEELAGEERVSVGMEDSE
ncbi:hypothetical protein LTR36_008333 [Oleoguttula mirabilis]|uniref:Uncharacterized protein n=1 Tax=Oleoguttula mirabilis TaxID=1507867 RepID=A0AAV9J7P4_9PEZI|nr:hypothetical protein LTR36_008333 [Oleoguttula mirabilis]